MTEPSLQDMLNALPDYQIHRNDNRAGTSTRATNRTGKTAKDFAAERAAAGLDKWEQPLAAAICTLDSKVDARSEAWRALTDLLQECRRGVRGSQQLCDALVRMAPGDPDAAAAVREIAKIQARKARKAGRVSRKAVAPTPTAPSSVTVDATATGASDDPLAEFNAEYAVVNEAGKTLVYAEKYDRAMRRQYYDRTTFDDFRKLHQNRFIGATRAGKWWLEHPDRRQFLGGVVFDPTGKHKPNELNLWRGFAVRPAAGDWSLLQRHIRDVVCGGNEEYFRYLMGWMARAVQHPELPGEVAVVMRGNEGCGKGTLARAFNHLFGQHGLHISNAKHLVGNFNSHLRDCVALFADEAFFAGDKQHVGVLKAIITEPYLTIEGKFQNAVQAPNRLHVMMASNESWVVPAGLEARRFFALDVGDGVKDDHAYFAAIWAQMDAGGYAAMLHDLQNYDLTGFNVRRVPVTEALQEQKQLSLTGPHAWWLDVLERGNVGDHGDWQDWVATAALYASYQEHEKRRQERRPKSRVAIGKFLFTVGGVPTRAGPKNAQQRGYRFGSLAYARIAFNDATKLDVAWGDEGAEGPPIMTEDPDLEVLLR